MKNISRRVFIKGLAVAGVAAAASTVLAGCNTNMIPGVDDGSEDEGTETPTNQKITLTDTGADKSMTIEATGFKYVSEAKLGIVSLHVDNQLATPVYFDPSLTVSGSEKYFLGVTYKYTDKDGNETSKATLSDVLDTTPTYSDNAFNASGSLKTAGLASKDAVDTKMYIKMPAEKEWEKIEITITLNGDYPGNATDNNHASAVISTGKFTFNK